MEYTIIIDPQLKSDGSVDVAFSDGKVQNLSGLTVSDKKTLHKELVEYGKAYEAGLQKTAVVVDPEVTKLVAKKQRLTEAQVEAVLSKEG